MQQTGARTLSESTATAVQSQEASYFCVKDSSDCDVYQTIDNPETNPPPLPSRLASVSSWNTLKASRTQSLVSGSQGIPTVSSVVQDYAEVTDRAYACIGQRQDNQTYDLPPLQEYFDDEEENLDLFENINKPTLVDSSVRINPLYAEGYM